MRLLSSPLPLALGGGQFREAAGHPTAFGYERKLI
jgi:hypothetical protein